MKAVDLDEIEGGKDRSIGDWGHSLCALGVLCGEELPFSPQRAQSPQRTASKRGVQLALSFARSVPSYSVVPLSWLMPIRFLHMAPARVEPCASRLLAF